MSAAVRRCSEPKITAKKVGDSEWAIYVNGRLFLNGLTHREVPFYKDQARESAKGRRP